jgi:uncharacterized protein YkwD
MQWLWAVNQILSVIMGVALYASRVEAGELPTLHFPRGEVVVCAELQSMVLGSATNPVTKATPPVKLVDLSPTPLPTSILEPEQPVSEASEAEPAVQSEPTVSVIPQPTALLTVVPTKKPAPLNLNGAVNTYRQQHGLGTLATRDDLCSVAARRLNEIGTNFSHDGWERAYEGVSFSGIAENIWEGSSGGVADVVATWDESPSHKQAMVGSWEFGCGAMGGGKAVFEFMR